MDKVTTFFNKCETSGMNQLVKAVFKIGLCSLDLQLLLKCTLKEVEGEKEARYRPAGEVRVRQSWQCRQGRLCHCGH